ncbi:MAG: carbonic anhydrase [Proteobacteria bacterium]|nr:carbonic anhydrase [Pseudomonadota bacterium]
MIVEPPMTNITSNPATSFNPRGRGPSVHRTAFVHPMACVIGDVIVGANVMVAPFASLRADEGTPFHIGAGSNVQDGVVIHALESTGSHAEKNTCEVHGKRYSVYIGERVSLAHQCQIHGPCLIEDDCFVGMGSFVFRSSLGRGSVIEPGAMVMGVVVPSGRYVPAGAVLREQGRADDLPKIDAAYPLRSLNAEVVRVNIELARAYNSQRTSDL